MTNDRNTSPRPEEAVPEGWVEDLHGAFLFSAAVEEWERRRGAPTPDEVQHLRDAEAALLHVVRFLVHACGGELPPAALSPLAGLLRSLLRYAYRRGGGDEGLQPEDIRRATAGLVEELLPGTDVDEEGDEPHAHG